jgi:hypothetical protein
LYHNQRLRSLGRQGAEIQAKLGPGNGRLRELHVARLEALVAAFREELRAMAAPPSAPSGLTSLRLTLGNPTGDAPHLLEPAPAQRKQRQLRSRLPRTNQAGDVVSLEPGLARELVEFGLAERLEGGRRAPG